MDEKTKAHYKARAAIIKAAAHPTRLFIIERLAIEEHCVCQLTEMIGADTSTVSKHLSVLKHAGIVDDEKRGLQVWYRLKMPCVLHFIACSEKVLRDRAASQLEAAG
ncbi:MAG: ArsR family transcriptional regulator [Candidatus Zixiibacteriota bacterium]|nr:MAG: ArsR family transcriptional regulator [candidate division Zixibacteria bacterium]